MPSTNDLTWKNNRLWFGDRDCGVRIVPDPVQPGMYRIEYPLGSLSDMANLTRVKDVAVRLVKAHLDRAGWRAE
jgi:hypothetical protein